VILPEEIEKLAKLKNYIFYVEQYKTFNKGQGFQDFDAIDK
jgi:hypothetical protein